MKHLECCDIKDAEVRKEFDNIIFEKSGQPTEWFSIKRAMRKYEGKDTMGT